jgi:PAS domain S-box-containing protein
VVRGAERSPESPLGSTDLSVETVESPEVALERLDEGGFDRVLLAADVDVTAFVATAAERFPGVPVVVATPDDDVATAALSAGAADVLRGGLDQVPAAIAEHRILSVSGDSDPARYEPPVRDRGRILDAAIDALDDVVYLVGEDETPVAWNSTLPERLGYTDEEVREMTPRDVYPDEQWSEAAGEGERERENDDRTVRMDLVTKGGERIPHEFRADWYHDDVTGQRIRIGVGRDVSHRDAYERQLRRQNDRLVEFTEKFVEELRRCLETAYAATTVTADEEAVELDAVEEALQGIERVVENARDLARAGRAVVDGSAVDLGAAARSAWGEVETGDATLSVTDCACPVECDPARLRQLLAELFENVVLHSSRAESPLPGDRQGNGSADEAEAEAGAGGLTVRVGSIDGADGDPRGFYVEDSGLGVPAAEREMVFDPGYTTETGAHGFGLAVVDAIASAHGWAVRLTDGEVGGARFEFHGVDVADGG